MQVQNVMVHDEYNSRTYTSDIGMIVLKDQAIFNDYVKPICLDQSYSDLSTLYGKLGTIAGWGYNELGVLNNNLTYINMPIIATDKCMQDSSIFNTVLSSKGAFCAGYGNGKNKHD